MKNVVNKEFPFGFLNNAQDERNIGEYEASAIDSIDADQQALGELQPSTYTYPVTPVAPTYQTAVLNSIQFRFKPYEAGVANTGRLQYYDTTAAAWYFVNLGYVTPAVNQTPIAMASGPLLTTINSIGAETLTNTISPYFEAGPSSDTTWPSDHTNAIKVEFKLTYVPAVVFPPAAEYWKWWAREDDGTWVDHGDVATILDVWQQYIVSGNYIFRFKFNSGYTSHTDHTATINATFNPLPDGEYGYVFTCHKISSGANSIPSPSSTYDLGNYLPDGTQQWSKTIGVDLSLVIASPPPYTDEVWIYRKDPTASDYVRIARWNISGTTVVRDDGSSVALMGSTYQDTLDMSVIANPIILDTLKNESFNTLALAIGDASGMFSKMFVKDNRLWLQPMMRKDLILYSEPGQWWAWRRTNSFSVNAVNTISGFSGFLNGATGSANDGAVLTDGTGVAGSIYECVIAGSHDYGGGSISLVVGDWIRHNGTHFVKVEPEPWGITDTIDIRDVTVVSGNQTLLLFTSNGIFLISGAGTEQSPYTEFLAIRNIICEPNTAVFMGGISTFMSRSPFWRENFPVSSATVYSQAYTYGEYGQKLYEYDLAKLHEVSSRVRASLLFQVQNRVNYAVQRGNDKYLISRPNADTMLYFRAAKGWMQITTANETIQKVYWLSKIYIPPVMERHWLLNARMIKLDYWGKITFKIHYEGQRLNGSNDTTMVFNSIGRTETIQRMPMIRSRTIRFEVIGETYTLSNAVWIATNHYGYIFVNLADASVADAPYSKVTVSTTGTLPGGLSAGPTYWTVPDPEGSAGYYLSTSELAAHGPMAGWIPYSSAGTGTQKMNLTREPHVHGLVFVQ